MGTVNKLVLVPMDVWEQIEPEKGIKPHGLKTVEIPSREDRMEKSSSQQRGDGPASFDNRKKKKKEEEEEEEEEQAKDSMLPQPAAGVASVFRGGRDLTPSLPPPSLPEDMKGEKRDPEGEKREKRDLEGEENGTMRREDALKIGGKYVERKSFNKVKYQGPPGEKKKKWIRL